MVRTLKICIVDPDPTKTQAFLSAHLSGGLWSLLARKYYPIGFLGVRTFRTTALDMRLIQRREGRWVIADLIGKRGRVRTVPIPAAAKDALDEWTSAAGITSGPIWRAMRKGGAITGLGLSAWAIWDVVVTAAKAAGISHLGPHDLRRTCAKLCRKAGGELEQVHDAA